MAIGYKATVYVESGPIGHAFIKLEAPGQPTITVGYYPVIHSPAAPGIVKNDAAVKNEQTGETTQHPGDLIKSFDIDANQYASMVGYVNHVANHPGDYGLIGNQCTSFVIDTLNAGGISNSANYADFTIIHPTDLIKPLSELSSNQIINPNATLDSAQTSANINNIYVGISGNEERAKFDMPNVDQNGNVISGATATNTVGNTDTTTTPTGSGGGYMGTDGVYHLNINGTSTPTTASTTVLGNIGNVTQSVLGPNATAPVAIIDPVTGEVTGYRVTSFDGEGEVGGIRTVVTFNPDGSFRSGETQYLVDGKSISEPLDATTAAKIDAGMATANITVTINDGTPAQPATTEPTSNPTPDTLGTGPGSTGDTLNNDSLQNPTYGGGDVDTPIISDDGYDPGTYIDSHDPTDVHSGADNINGLDLPADYQMPITDRDAQQANNALNLFNTLVNGLQNWDNASDLARIQTAVTLYNQLNSLNGMNMPNMGGVGAGLSLYSAIQNGDYGGMVVSGVQLGNALSSSGMGVSQAIADTAIAQAIGLEAAQVVPVLGLIVSLVHAEENPLGVVIAAVSIACPVCGIFLAFAQIIATKSPVSVGEASATFDEAGNLIVNTDEDKNGGGSTANQWMQQLAHGAQLAGLQTPLAGAFAAGMPSVGYRYAPDELNNIDKDGKPINGYLTLNWTGQDGKAYSRHYLGNGESAGWGDMGDEGSMAEDFFELMQSSFELYPPLMYEQLDGGVLQLDYGVATLVHATNTQKYNGQAEHTHGGEEETDAAQDQAITIEAGDKRLVQDNSQTVQNQSKQTHATVAASSLHTVDNASEQCYVFDSKLGNQYDGYMPKKLIKIALSNHIAANDGAYQIIA